MVHLGVATSYVVGIALCWSASMFTSMGNVLFKYHNILRTERIDYPKSVCSYWHIAISLLVFGSIASVISFALLPLSINCVHAALPIFLGEVFSGWIIPHNRLDASQWFLILLILISVTGVVAFGDHSTEDNVANEFEKQFVKTESIIYFSSCIIIGLSAVVVLFTQPLPEQVAPCTFYNFSGPVLTAVLGNVTQVCARISMDMLKCFITTCEGEHLNPGWYALFVLFPISASIQLFMVSFTMGKLHLVTVIPIYGTLLIVLPSMSGVLMLGEKPKDLQLYSFSIALIVVFVGAFVYITQNKKAQKEIDEADRDALLVDSVSYASILSNELNEHTGNINSTDMKVTLPLPFHENVMSTSSGKDTSSVGKDTSREESV